MTRALLLFAACALACLPVPHEIEGRRCDEAHPCGEDLVCNEAGRCVRRGSSQCPPASNLTQNGGFEEGEFNWKSNGSDAVIGTQPEVVRTGALALRALAVGTGVARGTQNLQRYEGFSLDHTLCAEAWVRRGDNTGNIFLYLRRHSDADEYEDVFLPNSKGVPAEGQWLRLINGISLTPQYSQYVSLRISGTLELNQFFYLDDVHTWLVEGAGANCLDGPPPSCL